MTSTNERPATPPNQAIDTHDLSETTAAVSTRGVSGPPAATDTFPAAVAPSEHSETAPMATSNTPPVSDPPADPKVATLLGMFPDFDTSLLQSVLESVSGDQDRAVDVLLGMSDPQYTSTERSDATQTELDEEIARRFMLEESEQQSWRPQDPVAVPYQPRTYAQQSPPGPYGSQPRPAEGDGMAQFQEQLGKFAETGKKTFNSLLSKVKAKMQEFDNPSGQSQPSGSAHPLPHGDAWNTPAQSQSYYDPNPPRSVEGYDVGGAAPRTSMNQPPSSIAQPIDITRPAVPSTTGASSPPPTNTRDASAMSHVDLSKIGLLPKRPVSLGSSPKPSTNVNDEEIEYVENPFEEATRP